VRQSWTSNRLPENLPLLIDHKAASLPEEVQQKLSLRDSEKTRWFDTHPCDSDRIKAVRQLNQRGVFRLSEPASNLFADFARLSKEVTRHHYQNHFELEFTEKNLMSSEEILRESAASAEADSMVRKYYGKVNLTLKALLIDGGLPTASEETISRWREGVKKCEQLRTEAERVSAECVAHRNRAADLTSAHYLTKAGFKLPPKDFGLPETSMSVGEQEIAARNALAMVSVELLPGELAKLDPFMDALRRRVTNALAFSAQSTAKEPTDLPELVRLLAAVGPELPLLQNAAMKLGAFRILAQNIQNHSSPGAVQDMMAHLATDLKPEIAGLQRRLESFPYPFHHARGALTVAEYARSEQAVQNELHRIYLDADAHVERLSALHYQLVGRVLARVNQAEKLLEGTSPGL